MHVVIRNSMNKLYTTIPSILGSQLMENPTIFKQFGIILLLHSFYVTGFNTD